MNDHARKPPAPRGERRTIVHEGAERVPAHRYGPASLESGRDGIEIGDMIRMAEGTGSRFRLWN